MYEQNALFMKSAISDFIAAHMVTSYALDGYRKMHTIGKTQ